MCIRDRSRYESVWVSPASVFSVHGYCGSEVKTISIGDTVVGAECAKGVMTAKARHASKLPEFDKFIEFHFHLTLIIERQATCLHTNI